MEFGLPKNTKDNISNKRLKPWLPSTHTESKDISKDSHEDLKDKYIDDEDGSITEEIEYPEDSDEEFGNEQKEFGEEPNVLGFVAEDIDSETVKEILSIAEQISKRENISRLESLLILSLIGLSLLLSTNKTS
jgi:hypothetical protein